MAKRYSYSGDVNLEYGGTFYDFSDWRYNYVSAVEVTDLDSETGFSGAVMIERKTINIPDDKAKLQFALSFIGATLLVNGDIDDNGRTIAKRTSAWRHVVTYACQAYGYYDPDGYSEILQLEKDQPMESRDGWVATKRLRANASLRNYVKRNYLRD